MRNKTVGELRKLIDDLDDDYTIEMSVQRYVPENVVNRGRYPWFNDTDYQDGFEFDDVGVSDKQLCISVNIPDDMIERIRNDEYVMDDKTDAEFMEEIEGEIEEWCDELDAGLNL